MFPALYESAYEASAAPQLRPLDPLQLQAWLSKDRPDVASSIRASRDAAVYAADAAASDAAIAAHARSTAAQALTTSTPDASCTYRQIPAQEERFPPHRQFPPYNFL